MIRLKITKEGWLIVNKLLLGNLKDMLTLHCEMLDRPETNDKEKVESEIQELIIKIDRTERIIELMEKVDKEFFEVPDDDCLDETIESLSELIEVALQITINADDKEIRNDAETRIKGLVATRDELILQLQTSG